MIRCFRRRSYFRRVGDCAYRSVQVRKEFPKLVRALDLLHLTFHGLRRAHATLALTAGVKPKAVSDRLGHSSIAVTMDIYSYCMPGMGAEAA